MAAAGGTGRDQKQSTDGGQILLQLLQNSQNASPISGAPSRPYDSLPPNHQDPAVAALGPSRPVRPWLKLPDYSPPETRPFPTSLFPFPANLLPPGCVPNTPSWPPQGSPSPPLPGFFPDNHQFQCLGLLPNVDSRNHGLHPPPPPQQRQQDGVSAENLLKFGSFKCEFLNHELSSDGNSFHSPARSDQKVFESHSPGFPKIRSDDCSPDFRKHRYSHQVNPEVSSHSPVVGKVFHNEKGRGGSQSKLESSRRSGNPQKSRGLSEVVNADAGRNGRWNGDTEDNGLIFTFHDEDEMQTRQLPRNSSRGDAGSSRLSSRSFQLDRPGHSTGSYLHSALASDIEESLSNLHGEDVRDMHNRGVQRPEKRNINGVRGEEDLLPEQLVESLVLRNEFVNKNPSTAQNGSRGKELKSYIPRELHLPGPRGRNRRNEMECRSDIQRFTFSFLSIYESLIPAEEEKAKQRQLLSLLEKLVSKEWPKAQLYLYGSCANSFGVSNSDIDVCLAMGEGAVSKSEILLKLAEILQSDNLQNVQALTRARVPIVKLMDPVTGLSCDICINNVLAVVNTKLLRDYAQIDVRLRQLAFIVKHWAKSRGVNETYQGTLSSYAYVLMCIHFLQLRRPAILPCLQEMEATYWVAVDDIECAYFDQVESLRDFGAHNKESIAQLLWAFFDYWAYRHDYANAVISVRTGSIISKQTKDWTRRIGNDRHLICIEDPFEISHDLGRVVDKHTIRILREEFERAAFVMRHDPNPSFTLFEPYIAS